MKKTKATIYIFGLALFFAMAGGVQADTVTDGNLRVTYDDPLFAVTNGAPGQTYTSDVTVENLGGADRRFQFELDLTADSSELTDKLFLKVSSVDSAGTEYCEWGCAGDKIVTNLDREEKFVKIIPGDSAGVDAKKLRFALTFDPDAGNDFQNLSAGFDMTIGFEDEFQEEDGGAGNNGVTGPGAGTTGLFVPFSTLTGTTAGVETGGEAQPGQGQGTVEGEETSPGIVEGDQISTCQSWPKWVWVLMLIAYFAAFLWRTFDKFKEQVEKRDIRWKWQAILAGVAFLVWYFFDKCREFWWFVILAMVGGAVVYLVYLYLFRKHIRETQGQIESGSGQKPPENPEPSQAPTSSEE